MSQFVLHKANERGTANHGWLLANFSFSFAGYFNPEKINFGALRVLNDDTIAAGMGFGTHPHDNMEIITIPLKGALAHKDSMGNAATIQSNDIQVMSAGMGILHSEFNPNANEAAQTLQIWVFPNQQNVTPRYQQLSLNPEDRKNKLQQILSPNENDEGVWIHQNAWFFRGDFETNNSFTYNIHHPENGLYLFVLEGSIKIEDQILEKRDAIGIWDFDSISIESKSDCELLFLEVPMSY